MKPNCHSIVLLGCLFLAASCSRDWGTVNGRPLEEALVLLELNQVKAEVAAEFQSRFGVSDSPGFWATPLGGIKPESRAQDRAVEESAALMVDWELAFRAGLLAQPTYEDSRRRWAEENRQRKEALAQGRPVYGPQELDEPTFLSHERNQLLVKLRQAWSDQGILAVSDGEVAQHFASHPLLKTSTTPDQIRRFLADRKFEALVILHHQQAQVTFLGT